MPIARTNGIETHYERHGEGRPVVLVHASILDRSMWDAQVDDLAADYEVITYDLRGHGQTGGSETGRYTIDLYVEDLDVLIDELDLDGPVVCGLSMGGMVALTYAARYPERISGLVVADAGAPGYRTLGEWFLFEVVYGAILPLVRLVGFERIERVKTWVAERLQPGASGDYENVERLRANSPPMATAEFVEVIQAMRRYRDITIDLSAVTVPTLVLFGENDLRFNRLHAADLGELLPDVEVEEIPDAGHAASLDNPEAFSGALRRHLSRLGADTASREESGSREALHSGTEGA